MEHHNSLLKYFLASNGVSTDTREDLNGKIFFALKGENFDGNQYAAAAIKNGATYAVIDDPDHYRGEKYILVENSLTALQSLALSYRKSLKIPVLAITGSNGKTTSKELISAVLSKKFNLHATQGNLNNHIGVPLTILSCPLKTEFMIVEMGANHLTEIHDLCAIAEPNYGLITNVGKAHLEGFGSFENIIKAKTEMYRHLNFHGGLIIINGNDEILMNQLPEGSNTFVYRESGLDLKGIPYKIILKNSDSFVKIDLVLGKFTESISSQLIGSFNYFNIQLACAIGLYFDVPINDIKNAIEGYIPKNNRTELREIETNTFVMDAYNANPSSMKESIQSFSKMGENRVLILGDMKELGAYSLDEHTAILNYISKLEFNDIFLVGEEFERANRYLEFKSFINISELKNSIDFNSFHNTHFLLKGSRSMKLEHLLDDA